MARGLPSGSPFAVPAGEYGLYRTQIGMTDTRLYAAFVNRVETIIFYEQSADALDAKSDEHRWEAARLIAEELDSGKSQRQLAREIGRDEKHVRLMRKCWELRGLKSAAEAMPPFNQVYNSPEVRGTPGSHVSPQPRPGSAVSPVDDPEIIDGVITGPDEPPMTNRDAARLIRHAEDAIPAAERVWDNLRRANDFLIAVRNGLRAGVTLDGPMSRGTIESYLMLTAEISPQLESASNRQQS